MDEDVRGNLAAYLTRRVSFSCRVSEPQTASLEELQQVKNFGKLLKKQEKELKELERKMVKRREELLQKYAVLFTELVDQTGKKKMLNPKKKR